MTAKQLEQLLRSWDPLDSPILIRSDHAKGKSEIVAQFAREKGLRLIDFRLGQMEVGDILGLPYKKCASCGTVLEGNAKCCDRMVVVTTYAPPLLLAPAFTEPCVLFFDELNRGTKDVQQTVFQLLDSRRYHDFTLHPGTYVIAAVNQDLEKYNVTEMDPALITRFATVDFEPTVDEWIERGRVTGTLDEDIIFVIGTNQQYADPPQKKRSGAESLEDDLTNPHCNRRGWTRFSKVYSKLKHEKPLSELREICALFVGRDAAVFFETQVKEFRKTLQESEANTLKGKEVMNMVIEKYLKEKIWSDEAISKLISMAGLDEKKILADEISKFLADSSRLTKEAKDRVKVIAKALPEEIFAKLFSQLPQTVQVKLYDYDKTFFGPFYNK
jgi:hypothetical protein